MARWPGHPGRWPVIGGRRRSGPAAWLVVPLLVLVACGVPGETEVILDGPAQQRGATAGGSVAAPPGPGRVTDAVELVERYLRAGAGGPKAAPEQLRRFFRLAPGVTWQPGPDLTVVRILSAPERTNQGGGVYLVTVEVQAVGVLTERGTVVEPAARTAQTLEFIVAPRWPTTPDQQDVPQDIELLISEPPPGMYLASEAIAAGPDPIYQPYPIYFWDGTGGVLVPDLRYLPLTVTEDERRRLLVQWVIDGPSDWLAGTVRALSSEIVLRSNVVYSDGRLVVDLTAQAAAADLTPLGKQLAWTLRPLYDGVIELRVEGQPKQQARAADSPTANPALLYAQAPMFFCVAGGRVVRACASDQRLPVLDSPDNDRVVAAAVAANKQYAALVRTGPGAARHLVVGQVREHGSVEYVHTGLTSTVMSRPAWLPPGAVARGLIAADGELRMFTAGSPRTSPVEVPVGAVTGVSVAPDGRRVVIAAAGTAYAGTLVPKGETLVVQRLRRLAPTGLTAISAVGWSRPDRVVLLGQNRGHYALTELTVDGAVEERLRVQFGDAVITQFSAYPDYPGDGSARGSIVIESQGKAWQVFAADHQELQFRQPPGTPAVPGTAPPVPAAPFYQD